MERTVSRKSRVKRATQAREPRCVYGVEPSRWHGKYRALRKAIGKRALWVRRGDDLSRLFEEAGRDSVWVARDAGDVIGATTVRPPAHAAQRILLLAVPDEASRQALAVAFRTVVPMHKDVRVLPPDELAAVLASPRRDELFIGGIVDRRARTVVLYRGTLKPLVIPFAWFRSRPGGPHPAFNALAVTDHGQTVALGAYEASADAILYEFDAVARARMRKNRIRDDRSLGGSIRRLRLQKGVRQSDFPGVTAKTIARIERNEILQPRSRTLAAIAKRLGVTAEELKEW